MLVPVWSPPPHLDCEPCFTHGTHMQVGCGVGNTIFPLLEINPLLRVHACDFSSVAVALVKEHPAYASGEHPAYASGEGWVQTLMHQVRVGLRPQCIR